MRVFSLPQDTATLGFMRAFLSRFPSVSRVEARLSQDAGAPPPHSKSDAWLTHGMYR